MFLAIGVICLLASMAVFAVRDIRLAAMRAAE